MAVDSVILLAAAGLLVLSALIFLISTIVSARRVVRTSPASPSREVPVLLPRPYEVPDVVVPGSEPPAEDPRAPFPAEPAGPGAARGVRPPGSPAAALFAVPGAMPGSGEVTTVGRDTTVPMHVFEAPAPPVPTPTPIAPPPAPATPIVAPIVVPLAPPPSPPEYTMIASVELTFTDDGPRLGVRSGTATFLKYQRVAQVLFADLKRATAGG